MTVPLIIVYCTIIIITATICGIIIQTSKNKYDKQQDKIKFLEKQCESKEASLKIIEDNIEIKKEEYEGWVDTLNNQANSFVSLDKERAAVESRLKSKQEELNSLNDIFAKNKQQILDAEAQRQQILENIDEKFQNDLKNLIENYENKSEEYEKQLNDLREKRDAAIQAAIEEYESKDERKFYMLQLSQEDIEDIKVLKQLEQMLHNKEILGKLIYKTYIEKAYTDLIGRVLNKEDFSGIYKITNELNQKCYIGQAASIKKRWQQHIKRAVGAEPLVNNKLYPAMQKDGVENFSFEVVDRCSKDKLSEREQYWQEYYKAKSYGYSIK